MWTEYEPEKIPYLDTFHIVRNNDFLLERYGWNHCLDIPRIS